MNEQKYKKISNLLFVSVIALFGVAMIDVILANVFTDFQRVCGVAWMVILALILLYLPAVLITLIILKRKMLKTLEQKQNG